MLIPKREIDIETAPMNGYLQAPRNRVLSAHSIKNNIDTALKYIVYDNSFHYK